MTSETPGGQGGQALFPPSFFLVLEGGEGSGKTTALAALAAALTQSGLDPVVTREPGGTPEGLALRAVLLAENGPAWDGGAEFLLMTAARIQHVKRVIEPALAAGRVVLCDRFVGSTLAYQGAGRGLPRELILDMHARLVGNIWPDLTILLDVDPRIGLARSARRLSRAGAHEGRFEALDLDFHERVRAEFLRHAQEDQSRSAVVDASRTASDVAADVIGIVEARMAGAARREGQARPGALPLDPL
jgi:dTMP kinase